MSNETFQEKKLRKQLEADARAAAAAAISPEDRLRHLDKHGYTATKEKHKLRGKINEPK